MVYWDTYPRRLLPVVLQLVLSSCISCTYFPSRSFSCTFLLIAVLTRPFPKLHRPHIQGPRLHLLGYRLIARSLYSDRLHHLLCHVLVPPEERDAAERNAGDAIEFENIECHAV